MHLILLLINNVIDSHIYSIPHMLKYDVAFKTKHYIFSSLFSIDHYSSISPSYFRFSFPSFVHTFLVVDSTELFKSQLGFVYLFFLIEKGIGFLSIHYMLYLKFINGLIIR